jgi:Domain of unknown function (DUF4115)
VAVVAVAVVMAGVALAVVELTGSSSHPSTSTSSHHHGTTPPPTTTTTTTAPAVVQPVTSTPSSATYQPTSTTYTVVVTAQTGACWVSVTNPDTGAVVWEGLVQMGASQSFPGSGSMKVELGAASAAAVTLDGVPVALPPGFHSPFYASFSPG